MYATKAALEGMSTLAIKKSPDHFWTTFLNIKKHPQT